MKLLIGIYVHKGTKSIHIVSEFDLITDDKSTFGTLELKKDITQLERGDTGYLTQNHPRLERSVTFIGKEFHKHPISQQSLVFVA